MKFQQVATSFRLSAAAIVLLYGAITSVLPTPVRIGALALYVTVSIAQVVGWVGRYKRLNSPRSDDLSSA